MSTGTPKTPKSLHMCTHNACAPLQVYVATWHQTYVAVKILQARGTQGTGEGRLCMRRDGCLGLLTGRNGRQLPPRID